MAFSAPGSGGYQGQDSWYKQVAKEIQKYITAITSLTGLTLTGDLTMSGAAVIFDATKVFQSAEITADGSAQATAHGLGRTPTIGIAYMTSSVVAAVISAVTLDGTNCTVTASNTVKYRILAM